MVLVLAVLVYRPGLDGPFLLDDLGSTNALKATSFSWVELSYDVSHNTSGLLGRPVSVLSLAVSRILHGSTDAWGFKYHNLLLHLLNGLLLFWLLLRLLPKLVTGMRQEQVFLVALASMTLWLLHPLMVSTVLYVVQRMAQLATLFTLAALLAYVQLRESLAASRLRFVCGVASFLLALALALFSKENGALILFYVLLIECLVYRGGSATQLARRRLWLFQGLFVLLPIVLGATYLLTHLERFADFSFRSFTMAERLLTQLHVLFFYLKLILLPVVSEMSLFHDAWPPTRSLDIPTLLLLGFWCTVAAAVLLLRKRAPLIAFGIGWFLVSHLMESTFFNLELVFEHRNYLAAAGLLLIPVYYLFVLAPRRMAGFLLLLVAPLFAFMTHTRVGEWQSTDMIYTMAVRDHPESLRARIPFAAMEFNRGNVDAALEHIRIAEQMDPRITTALAVHMLFLCGRDELGEIPALLDEAIYRAATYAATPGTISMMDSIMQQVQQQRCKELEPERMLDWLQAALAQEDNRNSREFTGYLQRQKGFFYYVMQERALGYEYMIKAFENTGLTSILGEIIDIEIQLGALETAEHLLGIMAETNRARFGTETLLLDKFRKQYEDALSARQASQTAVTVP